jgi:hypothetical protein
VTSASASASARQCPAGRRYLSFIHPGVCSLRTPDAPWLVEADLAERTARRGMRRPYFLFYPDLSPTVRSERVIHLTDHSRSRLPRAATLLLGGLVLLLTLAGGLTTGPASASSPNATTNQHSATTPNGDSGTSTPHRAAGRSASPSASTTGLTSTCSTQRPTTATRQ